MSETKLDRYLIEEAIYCDADDVAELEATNVEMREALEALVKDDHIPEWKRISINMLLKKARGES